MAERAPVERDVAGSNPVPRPKSFAMPTTYGYFNLRDWCEYEILPYPGFEHSTWCFYLVSDPSNGINPCVNISVD